MSTEDTYDYTSSRRPITVEVVKESIIQTLKDSYDLYDEQINHPEVQSVINQKVDQIMFGFWNNLTYMEENYEGQINDVLDKVDDLEE